MMQSYIEKVQLCLRLLCFGRFYMMTMLLSGMMFSLCFAPVFFYPALFSLAIYAYHIRHATTISQLLLGSIVWAFGANLTGLYWIAIAPTVYGEEMWPISLAALLGIPALISIPMILTAYLTKQLPFPRYFYFYFAVIWILFEWLRSWLFTGFPWNLVAYSFADYLPLMQSVSVVGVYGVGFVVIYICTNWLCILEDTKDSMRQFIAYCMTAIFAIFIMLSFGYIRLSEHKIGNTDVTVRLVQAAIPQDVKWDKELALQHIVKHQQLSNMPFAVGGKKAPDLILWPESAITKPIMGTRAPSIITQELPQSSMLITGGIDVQRQNAGGFAFFVAMFAMQEEMIYGRYHKSHLVPFGEYVPFQQYLPFKKLTDGMENYSAGLQDKVIELPNINMSIRPLICYESIFPNEVTGDNSVYDALVNITNDSWYGNSSGPYQHFETTKIRAIEYGVPLLRVASNGISAIIDSLGRVQSRTNLNEITVLDGYLPKKLTQSTIYSLFGNLCALFYVIFLYYLQKCAYKTLKDS